MTLLSEDRELLAAFRAGNSRSLEDVYRHYFPLVTRLLRRGFVVHRIGQPSFTFALTKPFELENAVQEVFTRAFDGRDLHMTVCAHTETSYLESPNMLRSMSFDEDIEEVDSLQTTSISNHSPIRMRRHRKRRSKPNKRSASSPHFSKKNATRAIASSIDCDMSKIVHKKPRRPKRG
jgi:hypothetical protein